MYFDCEHKKQIMYGAMLWGFRFYFILTSQVNRQTVRQSPSPILISPLQQ